MQNLFIIFIIEKILSEARVKQHILFKVFIAIVLAMMAGWLTGPDQELWGVSYLKIYTLMGQLFLNALNLVVVPLVAASIITGTARIGSEPSFGWLGAKTFGFYILTTFFAVLIGLGGFLLISPQVSSETVTSLSQTAGNLTTLTSQGDTFDRISQILLRVIPSNIFAVASQGQMLGVLFFSILFGFFISKIDSQYSLIMLGFWKGLFQIMMQMTHLVMRALPFGVFGLVAKVIATTGIESITSVGIFLVTVVTSSLIYALIALPILLLISGVNPLLFFRAIAPALVTAFSTSSSAATLPVTMECLEERAGVSTRICNFALPLGTSLNMSGGALYLCAASLFIGHAYGIDLSATTIGLIVFMSMLTSMGIAGIPSASLVSLLMILQSIGVPAEGVGLILAIDRLLDMCRTTVNVLGNATCTVLIARSERESILHPSQKLSPL